MWVFILFSFMFAIDLSYSGLRAGSKLLSFFGIFSGGMCAMCVIIGLGYMMGAN